MKSFRICWPLVVALLSLGLVSTGFAQGAQESAPSAKDQHSSSQSSEKKVARTWTNDDVTTLRTPADAHMDQEDSSAQKAAAESASGTKQTTAAPPSAASNQIDHAGSPLPDNKEAVEALIQKTEVDLQRKQKVLDQANADVDQAKTDLERSSLRSNVDLDKEDLSYSQEDLKSLQARLAELKSKNAGASEATKPSQATP
jgi:hypothetical protein